MQSFEQPEIVPVGRYERRRHKRRPAMGQVLIPAELLPDNFGLLVDISLGGIAVQTVARMEPGAAIMVRCKLPPDNTPVEISGQVIWSNAEKVAGIRFVDMPTATLEHIRAALKHLDEALEAPIESEPIRFDPPVFANPEFEEAAAVPRDDDGESSVLDDEPDAALVGSDVSFRFLEQIGGANGAWRSAYPVVLGIFFLLLLLLMTGWYVSRH